jgi:Mg-chelatase subunit ChlI
MADAVKDNWPVGELIIVPDACASLWSDIQADAQDRIAAALQAMYAALLQQPLSPQLAKLVWEIEARLEGTQRGR